MADFNDFLTVDGLIDGEKVTSATSSKCGVIRPGSGLSVYQGLLSPKITDIIKEIPEASDAEIDAIFN